MKTDELWQQLSTKKINGLGSPMHMNPYPSGTKKNTIACPPDVDRTGR